MTWVLGYFVGAAIVGGILLSAADDSELSAVFFGAVIWPVTVLLVVGHVIGQRLGGGS